MRINSALAKVGQVVDELYELCQHFLDELVILFGSSFRNFCTAEQVWPSAALSFGIILSVYMLMRVVSFF